MTFVDKVTPGSSVSYGASVVPPGTRPQDYGDRTWALYNDWAAMYYQNAYNTAMLNYQNEFNSPLQQMLRYQEAGLNPFLAQADNGNMGPSHAGAAPRGGFTPPSKLQGAQVALQGINMLQQVLGASQEIYDYINYGAPSHAQGLENLGLQGYNLGVQGQLLGKQLDTANANLRKAIAEAGWSEYWNGVDNPLGVEYSPRAKYMENSTERIESQIDQLNALVNVIYPSQEARNIASAALDSYKIAVMRGENDAILNINTGNEAADSILKSVVLKLTKMAKFGLFF